MTSSYQSNVGMSQSAFEVSLLKRESQGRQRWDDESRISSVYVFNV